MYCSGYRWKENRRIRDEFGIQSSVTRKAEKCVKFRSTFVFRAGIHLQVFNSSVRPDSLFCREPNTLVKRLLRREKKTKDSRE